MATFQELTDRISRMVHPQPGVDIIRSVEKLILNYRALLIRRDYEKSTMFHDRLVQSIPEIPVQEIGVGEYDPSQGAFKTSYTPNLPHIIRLKSGYAIRFVGTADRKTSFHYVHPDLIRMVKHSRYTNKENLYTILGSKIFLMNIPQGPIAVEAIFEDPTHLFDFNDRIGTRVYDIDTEFPITEDLEQAIVQSILSAELRVLNPERVNEIHTDPQ